MERLILLRHATAEAASPTDRDIDRPLSERGRDEALQIGAALAAAGVRPTHALVSPAVRTRQTWRCAAEGADVLEAETQVLDRLFNASPSTLHAVRDAAELEAGEVVIVAHNPGIQAFAIDLLVEAAASAEIVARVQRSFAPATALVLAVDAAGRPAYEGLFKPGRPG